MRGENAKRNDDEKSPNETDSEFSRFDCIVNNHEENSSHIPIEESNKGSAIPTDTEEVTATDPAELLSQYQEQRVGLENIARINELSAKAIKALELGNYDKYLSYIDEILDIDDDDLFHLLSKGLILGYRDGPKATDIIIRHFRVGFKQTPEELKKWSKETIWKHINSLYEDWTVNYALLGTSFEDLGGSGYIRHMFTFDNIIELFEFYCREVDIDSKTCWSKIISVSEEYEIPGLLSLDEGNTIANKGHEYSNKIRDSFHAAFDSKDDPATVTDAIEEQSLTEAPAPLPVTAKKPEKRSVTSYWVVLIIILVLSIPIIIIRVSTRKDNDRLTTVSAPVETYLTVTKEEGLFVREAPGFDAEKIKGDAGIPIKVKKGIRLRVINSDGNWRFIQDLHNPNLKGWIVIIDGGLTYVDEEIGVIPDENGSNPAIPNRIVIIDEGGSELRSSPSLDAHFIEMVPYNAECKVLDRQKGWFKIEAPSGAVGWLSGYGEITGNAYVREVQ